MLSYLLNFFASPSGVLLVFAAFGIGALGSIMAYRHPEQANAWGNGGALAGSAAGLLLAFGTLCLHRPFGFTILAPFPFFSVSLAIDYLSAFFVGIISLIAFACSLYGMGYVKRFYRTYSMGSLGFFYNIFIASMVAVVTTHDVLFFLASWEIMSLASYFLVIFERKDPENIKAGYIYFTMTHVGTALITLALLLLSSYAGSFDFFIIKSSVSAMPLWVKDAAFLLALFGFGTKAGIIPLHIWLPRAHPAAPSHVSALMSGVMIKTGVYMCIRMFLDIMSGGAPWWGILVLAIGGVSSVLGVLYALAEHDIKKLLAYHSIENIGIIFLGLGSALMFSSLDMPAYALLALAAALFHTLNHGLFKALLFLAAGSVVSAMHTRNIDEYGGLIKRLPYTAFFFLIGSIAISGLPPLNGFASEWLTFQSFFAGMKYATGGYSFVFIFAAAALAFTGGLAAACFVKAFGATFLARARSSEAAHAKEAGFGELSAMGLLAAAVIAFGFFAGPAAASLTRIGSHLGVFTSVAMPSTIMPIQSAFALHGAIGSTSLPLVFALLAAAISIGYAVVRLGTGQRREVIDRTWDCGTDLTPRMEMTATGFSQSIVTIFGSFLRPFMHIRTQRSDSEHRMTATVTGATMGLKDVYQAYFYRPLGKFVDVLSTYAKWTQQGNISAYILYMFVALLILLMYAAN